MKNVHQSYYESGDVFGYEDNFFVAMGISDYIAPYERRTSIEDPSIGNLKFYIKSWGENAPSGTESLFLELESRDC